jgi:glutamyl-tRNA reductase
MIAVVGFSHHTAPIALREQFTLDEARENKLARTLVGTGAVGEIFFVSTCNRVELYAAAQRGAGHNAPPLTTALREAIIAESPALGPHLYEYSGSAALRHLFRVASSLDSMVVGEAQILGQLKQGYERAVARGSVGPILGQVFPQALRSAKRVRSETEIGAGQVSVPTVAVDLAARIFGNLKGHRAALVGTGEMGQMVGKLLRDQGARLTVVGRSEERSRPIAERLGGEYRSILDLGDVVRAADVIVSSTSSEVPIFPLSAMTGLHRERRGRSLFLIDLAVPRDVDPRVGDLEGVFLYNIDDLSSAAQASRDVRALEAERAQKIVEEVLFDFEKRKSAAQVAPTIKALRDRAREAFSIELERSLRGKLRDLQPEQRAAVERMIDAGVNRLLHAPSTRLREGAGSGEPEEALEWARALTELFELEPVSSPEHTSAFPPFEEERVSSDDLSAERAPASLTAKET